MGPDQMHQLLRTEPFQPLLVRLTNGTTYSIRYPNLAQITEQVFVLGIPDEASNGRLAEDIIWIDWPTIATVEPLLPAGATA